VWGVCGVRDTSGERGNGTCMAKEGERSDKRGGGARKTVRATIRFQLFEYAAAINALCRRSLGFK
jgi:hypothetical protein